MAVGFAAVEDHLADAREIPQRRVETGAAEFAARARGAIHDVEASASAPSGSHSRCAV